MSNHVKQKYLRKQFAVWTPVAIHVGKWLRYELGWTWDEVARYFDTTKESAQGALTRMRRSI